MVCSNEKPLEKLLPDGGFCAIIRHNIEDFNDMGFIGKTHLLKG